MADTARGDSEKSEQKLPTLKKRVEPRRRRPRRARERSRRIKNDYVTKSLKLKKQLEERKRRDREAVERMRLQVEAQEITRDYNLGQA